MNRDEVLTWAKAVGSLITAAGLKFVVEEDTFAASGGITAETFTEAFLVFYGVIQGIRAWFVKRGA